MKTVPSHPFVTLATLAVLAFATVPFAPAQDDIYDEVRFVNQGGTALEITVWNPRGSRNADTWKVEAGKTLDLTDEKGEKLRFGIISSFIKVGDLPEKSLHEVASRAGDFHVVTWDGKGFVPPGSR